MCNHICMGAEDTAAHAEPRDDHPSVDDADKDADPTAAEAPSKAEATAEDGADLVESSVVAVGEGRRQAKADEPKARRVTSTDPRFAELDALLDRNDWSAVQKQLGPYEDLGKLPPNLALIAALAHHERAAEGDPDPTPIAIRCMAGLLAVDEDSPAARVLAKRLLRKNPVQFREIKAPPARVSALIIVITLVVGSGVGWLVSMGSWRAIANVLHL
jgi:hypothetical protein